MTPEQIEIAKKLLENAPKPPRGHFVALLDSAGKCGAEDSCIYASFPVGTSLPKFDLWHTKQINNWGEELGKVERSKYWDDYMNKWIPGWKVPSSNEWDFA